MAKQKLEMIGETEVKRTRMRHDKNGGERLNPKPMQPPLGYKRAPTLAEQIRQQVLAAKLEALDQLEETEDEADDFEVGEDFEPMSPHENESMPTIKELRKRAEEINREIKRQQTEQLRAKLAREMGEKGGRQSPADPATAGEKKEVSE